MRRTALTIAMLSLSSVALAAGQQAPKAAPAQAAQAQQAAPKLTAAQEAELQKQNAEMSQAALKVAQMVDANQIGELWDGSSEVAKKAVTRDAFIKEITAERARLGAVAGRGEAAVTRVQYPEGAPVPAGLYLNVSFPSRFAASQQPVRELVSFRLDNDKVWRVSGYSLRTPQQAPQAQAAAKQ